jgi:pimeloyl-ACP methyl ester carboxylesterase
MQRFIASLQARVLLAIEPDLKRLRVPTLMVWGSADRFFHQERIERPIRERRRGGSEGAAQKVAVSITKR